MSTRPSGAFRHEGSHALAATAEGVEVTQFVFWPSFDLGKFTWGYANWRGSTTWFTIAAPYFCDLLVFLFALLIILEAKPRSRWLWLNVLIIGMLSSLVNTAYSYFGALTGRFNDVGELLGELNPIAVRLYFTLTLLFYAWGITTAIFAGRRGVRNEN